MPVPDYRLSWFQRDYMIDTCELYEPGSIISAGGKRKRTGARSTTPVWTDVPCWFEIRGDVATAQLGGRFSADNAFTQDRVWFHAGQEVNDTWVAKLTTPGHPSEGEWWHFTGQAQDMYDPEGGVNEKALPAKNGLDFEGV